MPVAWITTTSFDDSFAANAFSRSRRNRRVNIDGPFVICRLRTTHAPNNFIRIGRSNVFVPQKKCNYKYYKYDDLDKYMPRVIS